MSVSVTNGPPGTVHVRVAIIGAGFGGLGTAIRLTQRRERDFVIIEAADDIGGTWRDNSYPGCACDVPSHLYSFSFAPNPQWSHTYSSQAEIWDYLQGCVERYGLSPHLRLGEAVRGISWDAAAGLWRIQTSRAALTADVTVLATGSLSEPAIPDLAGLASFAGTTFHSARWRHDHDLAGRRVAVLGTGASAIQFVPAIASAVEHLALFQRTPAWVLPHSARRISSVERAIYRSVPAAQRCVRACVRVAREAAVLGFRHPRLMRLAQRLAAAHLRRQVADPDLRRRLQPAYTMGCKRILLSNDYYPALARRNVEVITQPIREVRPHAVVTADGTEHAVDTIIFGTGFHVSDAPMAQRIRGRGGLTLAQTWDCSPRAYLGVTVTGFPNLFLILGPNTGLGHTSVLIMMEKQIENVIAALDYLHGRGVPAVEPTAAALTTFTAEIDAAMRHTVWARGGCSSWYLDSTGRVSALWPSTTWAYGRRLRRFRPEDYQVVPDAGSLQPAPGPVINFVRRGSGEPLLLLHGVGHNWHAWEPLLQTLAASHEVIAVDLPGFGDSPMPACGMPQGMPETVAGLAAFLRAEGIHRPHVAGNSLGGVIALELGAAGLASSVTALAPAGFANDWERRWAIGVLRIHRVFAHLPPALIRRAVRVPTIRALCFGMVVSRPRQIPAERAFRDAVALRRKGFEPVARAARGYHFTGDPQVPVTVAWGTRDRILLPRQAERARSQLPRARHVSLPGCGHVVMSDDPELVSSIILQTTAAARTQAAAAPAE